MILRNYFNWWNSKILTCFCFTIIQSSKTRKFINKENPFKISVFCEFRNLLKMMVNKWWTYDTWKFHKKCAVHKETCQCAPLFPTRLNVSNHTKASFHLNFPCHNLTSDKTWFFLETLSSDELKNLDSIIFMSFSVFWLWKTEKNYFIFKQILNFFF